MKARRGVLNAMGMREAVVSTTLVQAEHPDVTIISGKLPETVAALKTEEGKDIWLAGGGVLFRSLLDAGLVDAMEISVFPVLLGAGTPLLPDGRRVSLSFNESKALPSGVLMLSYSVSPA